MIQASMHSKLAPLAAALMALIVFVPTAHAKRINLALAFGQDVKLIGDDTLSVRAVCLQADGSGDRVRIYAVTDSPAILRGYGTSYPGDGSYLLPGMTPINSQLLMVGNSFFGVGTDVGEIGGLDAGAYVFHLGTRRGYAIAAETSFATLNLGGSDCHVSVDIEIIKRFKPAKS